MILNFLKGLDFLQIEADAHNPIFSWEAAPHMFLQKGKTKKAKILSLLLFPDLKLLIIFYNKSWFGLSFLNLKGLIVAPQNTRDGYYFGSLLLTL